MIRVVVVIGVLMLTMSSCGSEENCTSGEIPTLSLSDLGCSNAERVVKLSSSQELELIRDQETFDDLVNLPCDISIDWQMYDLFIGEVALDQEYLGMKNSAVFNCVENRIEVTVAISLSPNTATSRVTWSFLIPKDEDFFIRPLQFD